jgi:hypothetical protein
MASLDWINSALQGLLPTLWMSLGLGLPWAYVILSTKQWHARATIGALALAVGPAWMTAWMLVLGVIGAHLDQRLFTPQWILAGSIIIALLGIILAWRKRKHAPHHHTDRHPFAVDEKLIISMIVIAVIIRWVHTIFWTFTAYDALWVYGYQGRLYFLEGFIPNSIDYYPQFLQLQYTYVQVLIGAIDDHAARMVIPMLHIGSILASYVLGQRIFNRRIGIYVAALWSLHPYVGHWSVIGDLEIPVTFSFTMAAAFFISAWMEKDDAQLRRNSAWIAGLMLSIAMYTKPTAGAFIWGVMLLVIIELLRTRFNLRQWQARFMVAFWTGLASIPLGAVWYVRNIALGHDAITFPPSVWLTLARRSGDHFNWIILVVIVGFLAYSVLYKIPLRRFVLGLIGISLLLLGVLPSNPLISPMRFDPPMSYMSLLEVSLSILGLGMIGFNVLPYIRTKILHRPSYNMRVIGWSLALALPYFITWFYSYSYHYRLGFAIVPLMILPTAFFIISWFTPERMAHWGKGLRWGYYLLLVALGLPGILAVTVDITWTRIWLADETLDSDRRKYQVFNPSLMEITFAINEYIDTKGNSPVVVAPGEQRLHFFFPQIQIIDQLVTTLDEFDALQPTHYIYGAQGREQYTRAGIDHTQTQLVSALGREDIFRLVKSHDDATFSYELYEYSGNRFDFHHDDYRYDLRSQDVFFGDYIRLHGVNIITQNHLYKGTEIRFETLWETLKDLPQDYEVVIEFDHRNWWKVDYYWVQQFARHEYGHYASNLWDVRELVQDDRTVALPDSDLLASGQRYTFNVALLDTTNNQFLPVFVDGEYVGEFYKIQDEYGYK